MTTTSDANAILMSGGGAKSMKFEDPGTSYEGTITAPPEVRQEREYDRDNPGGGAPKFFPSGDPIMGIIVTVQTDRRDDADDDGKRTFYVEGRYVKEAVRNAVRASGARGLEVGGHLKVTFTHREDPMDKRSRKHWDVTYTPAGNAALMSGHAEQATAPAPAVAPAPAAAPAAPVAAPTLPATGPVNPATGAAYTAEQIAAAAAAGITLA